MQRMLCNVCCAAYRCVPSNEGVTCGAMPMLAGLHNEVARLSICAYEAQPPIATAMPPYNL
jgi:hypothetical protein